MNGMRGDNFLVTPALTVSESEVDMIAELLGEALQAFAPKALAYM